MKGVLDARVGHRFVAKLTTFTLVDNKSRICYNVCTLTNWSSK